MMHRTHTGRWLLLALIAVALSAGLPACELLPQSPDQTAATRPDDPGQINSPAAGATIGALIHRIDMPLDVSLDASWAQVDEQAVPMLMHGMWQANGLRIGILHADQALDFADTLPAIQGESRAKLYSSHYPTSIRSTPRLIDPVTIDLTAPPRSPTLYRARDGRLQLLVRIGRSETGQAFLELTPHHYKPKPDLIPRSPLEKQLDGRVFHELSVMLPISPDTAIVVGLHRPWPVVEDGPASTEETADGVAPETTEGKPEVSDAADTDVSDQPSATTDPPSPPDVPQPPAIPNHLGRSLMAGTRAGHPTQIMLIISIIEDDTPGDTQGNGK